MLIPLLGLPETNVCAQEIGKLGWGWIHLTGGNSGPDN